MHLKVFRRLNLDDVEIRLAGAKNALLHLMFASLLPVGKTVFNNVSKTLRDYHAVCDILQLVGAKVIQKSENNTTEIIPYAAANQQYQNHSISVEYTRKTRTSLMLRGVLAKRTTGKVVIGYPGGCAFGDQHRHFDIHLEGFSALGAKVDVDEDHISIEYRKCCNAKFTLRYPSVGASINLMFFAVIGDPVNVTLYNIALEPEVIEVSRYLNQCGGKIRIDYETRCMYIQGVKALNGNECFSVMYDRIQTMTYGALAYLHHINITISGVNTKEYIKAPLEVLNHIGAKWEFSAVQKQITFLGRTTSRLMSTNIIAKPYPGFPTDLQPIFTVLLSCSNGESKVQDTVYPERMKYATELQKLGFPVHFKEGELVINPLGNQELEPAKLKSTDLRGGMAVVMAASLCTRACAILNAEEIFRGYENVVENLTNFMHISIDRE